jgi:hypothetical protein
VNASQSASGERVETRYVLLGVAAVASLLVLQLVGGWIRQAVVDEPSHLELVEKCLTERSVPFEPATGDFVAQSADRGALRTTVEGNGVTIALGGSERDAERVFESYASVAEPDLGARLDRHRKVVFLWDAPPSVPQRDFAYLCTLDAQD